MVYSQSHILQELCEAQTREVTSCGQDTRLKCTGTVASPRTWAGTVAWPARAGRPEPRQEELGGTQEHDSKDQET